ncbi:coiled-coil domain-containing protein 186 [Condylostylus longicornis]|uniref:coiled-coil domain-containing protein 186 n=1 Tax=Condylostylus longicornis TaxID=2530218 RepID=UPI00244DC96E|nr:coiled-coil domain-containing protein 186 [Condylostylus longicornis]
MESEENREIVEDVENIKLNEDNIVSELENIDTSNNSPELVQNIVEKNQKEDHENVDSIISLNYQEELSQATEKINNYEKFLEQLKLALNQKDNIIALYDREKSILEKEKNALKKQADLAIKEKETIVLRFASNEKALIDAKKETEHSEKQLSEAKKEIKNITGKYQILNEEKSRIQYMLEEKCLDIRKHQKEIEKLKTDVSNLETKLKWNTLKLNQETDAKIALEKKLEEEKFGPRAEEKNTEQKRIENEASMILLKHDVDVKDKQLDSFKKENKSLSEKILSLQENLSKEILEKNSLFTELEKLKEEHTSVQNALSKEMLNSAKLRGQLEELNVLQARNTINEEKISNLNDTVSELEEKLKDCSHEIQHLRDKEKEFLGVNKEMSEKIANLQNHILLQNSKVLAAETQYEIIKKEKKDFDTKYDILQTSLNKEIEQRNEERLLLSKHLSEKTKLYENVKIKLEDALGDLDATKKKHSQIFKELNREIHKYKRLYEENQCKVNEMAEISTACVNNSNDKEINRDELLNNDKINLHQSTLSSSQSQQSDSESDVQSNSSLGQLPMEPSKEYLVNRILKLQKAAARQTEKIDFLENHTMQLVAELQKKSKLIQYYMVRDQVGALTSTKSDQNKTELAKYGGVMSAIYGGIKGANHTSMTLELSLEINKKLQAVLEDTLLKNITLKENLDVLGLEVDKLTRELQKQKK